MAAPEYLPHYTYEEYRQWEGRWELIGGIPYAMAPAPIIEHQRISNKIAHQLEEQLQQCEECIALLPVDWKISEDTIVQPDNMVYCGEIENEAYITKSPRIVFEVLSPATAIKDANLKFALYEREGVRYYVMVDPRDRVAHIYENVEGRFVKRLDATKERFLFDIECPIEFDFGRIW
jgi:Uma2 family endonuclease